MNKEFTEQDLQKALEYATRKHDGQFRKGGLPYITHPVSVCHMAKTNGYGLDYQITALFHDLLEDTDATEEEILKLSNQEVLDAVKVMTKPKGYNNVDYLGAIKLNKIAFVIKGFDRLHNLQSAVDADEKFRLKYIKETLEWYMDFNKDIPKALENLQKSLI